MAQLISSSKGWIIGEGIIGEVSGDDSGEGIYSGSSGEGLIIGEGIIGDVSGDISGERINSGSGTIGIIFGSDGNKFIKGGGK